MALFLLDVPKVEEKTLCNECGKARAPLRCSACKSVCYCDDVCQRTDWPKHIDACKAIKERTAKAFSEEPTAEALTLEESAVTYRESVRRCGFSTKSKMVFVFWTPRSPYGQYHYAQGLDVEPAHNKQRVNIFTISEFSRLGFFKERKQIRSVVKKILALQRTEGVWASVVCMDDGCLGVKGGIYEPQ